MSSRIYSVNPNSVITDQADAESNKRSLMVGITLFSMGLPLLIIGSTSTGEDKLAMLIPGAVMFGIGAFVTVVAAVIGLRGLGKRATSNINYYPKPRVIMSHHPLSGKTFVLQNQYPGYDHKFVSFRTEDLALRVIYEQHDAMPIQFVAVEGKPNTYHLLNKYKDGSKADRAYDQWISFANDGKWLYCRYPKKTDAMPVLIEHVEADTIIMNNQWPGQEAFWLSFANEGKWMRVTYQKKEAMPMKLISYSPIEILEAVPGKPVRFRINNRPSSNDAWVGIYPADAGDQDHGDRWGWLRDKHMDNASLPGQSEGRWSIRIFSDGGYDLFARSDFILGSSIDQSLQHIHDPAKYNNLEGNWFSIDSLGAPNGDRYEFRKEGDRYYVVRPQGGSKKDDDYFFFDGTKVIHKHGPTATLLANGDLHWDIDGGKWFSRRDGIPLTQGKYMFVPEEMAWNEHNGRAKAMGGHLASISSAEENEEVTRISGGKPVWIGGIRKGGLSASFAAGADHWYWSDGQPWTYTNWHPGEPNNAGGHENRVHLGLQARGTWNDVHEGWSGPAVYKLPAETSPATTSSKNIEILEAVPGKPVRFRINNPPSSNDAWVGVYPASAGDHEHGEQGNRWHWIRDIDVNNASFPAQSEGNWSIRVFSDGGFALHHREDFEIERIPFGEQLKIKQEIQEKKEEMSEQIKEKMEEVEEKLPEEIKETESFQEIKSTVENTVESLDEKANQAIEEVIVESTEQMEQVQEKVILSLEDSLSKLNDTLERLDKSLMTKDRENIISELSGSQMNLNLTVDRIDNTIGYGIDEALRGGKTIVGNIEGIPHSVSIKVPKSMNDFASGLEKGQTIEQKVTLSTFNSVRKMLEFVIDK